PWVASLSPPCRVRTFHRFPPGCASGMRQPHSGGRALSAKTTANGAPTPRAPSVPVTGRRTPPPPSGDRSSAAALRPTMSAAAWTAATTSPPEGCPPWSSGWTSWSRWASSEAAGPPLPPARASASAVSPPERKLLHAARQGEDHQSRQVGRRPDRPLQPQGVLHPEDRAMGAAQGARARSSRAGIHLRQSARPLGGADLRYL